jgi:hypothetical protein
MISKAISNSHSPQIELNLPKNQTLNTILNFVKEALPIYEYEFKNSNIQLHLEDDISRELACFFADKAKENSLIFRFEPKHGVDFSVSICPYKIGSLPIFVIEAKRLYKGSKDYVYGETGGIERFKRELPGYGKHLINGAMIGYIQDFDENYWFNRVNNWILSKISSPLDLLN